MAYFGMYNNSYIGGAPNFLSGGMRMGMHPSCMTPPRINYFTGTPMAAPQMYPLNSGFAPNAIPSGVPVQDSFNTQTNVQQIQILEQSLSEAKNQQGIVGKFWDGVKGATGIGLSSKKCASYIEKAKAGQISVNEAYENVSKYAFKQKSAVNMLSSIASGLLAATSIGLCVPTGGLSLSMLFTAAGVGAGVKAGVKTLDRATNNVDGDALNAKEIAKDGVSGALNGAVTVLTAGIGTKGIMAAETAKETIKQSAIAGAKAGAISGAAMGAGDYSIECAFDDKEKFELDKMLVNAAYGAAAGCATGAVVGGVTAYKNLNKGTSGADIEPPKGGEGAKPNESNIPPQDGPEPIVETNPEGGPTPLKAEEGGQPIVSGNDNILALPAHQDEILALPAPKDGTKATASSDDVIVLPPPDEILALPAHQDEILALPAPKDGAKATASSDDVIVLPPPDEILALPAPKDNNAPISSDIIDGPEPILLGDGGTLLSETEIPPVVDDIVVDIDAQADHSTISENVAGLYDRSKAKSKTKTQAEQNIIDNTSTVVSKHKSKLKSIMDTLFKRKK